MAKDLTSIGKSNGISIESHLLSATYNGDTHLAVIRQTTAWTNKELVATPKSSLFAWAYASGKEAYPTTQGGSNVKNDTDTLINGVSTQLASATWNAGPKAAFSYFCRAEDPYSVFKDLTDSGDRSGHGRSVVALKFSLRGLPLAKMSSYSAYIRAYIPSLTTCRDFELPTSCVCFPGTLYNSAATLDIRFTEGQPSIVEDGTEAKESFDLGSYCNNGLRPSSDVVKDAYIYDPMDVEHLGDNPAAAPDQNLRVFAVSDATPTPSYYADMPLTGACKTFLSNHMGEFWAAISFRAGNAFSSGTSGQGLAVRTSALAFVQRFELVLRCTSSTFN